MIKTNFSSLKSAKKALGSIEQEFNLNGTESNIHGLVRNEQVSLFNTRGLSGGQLWEALADGSDRSPLIDTGLLQDAMTNPTLTLEEGGRRLNVSFSGKHAELGPLHQEKREINRVSSKGKSYKITIPARPVLQTTDQLIAEIQDVVTHKVVDGIGKKLNEKLNRR